MAPAAACFAVAGCLFAAAGLGATVSPVSPAWQRAAYLGAAGVFLLRGLAGFIGPLWRYAAGTPFSGSTNAFIRRSVLSLRPFSSPKECLKMSADIAVVVADHVMKITFTRPTKKNALSNAMYGVWADA